MALLTSQQIRPTGPTITYTAAAGGGDALIPSDRVFLHVKNGSGVSVDVTIAVPGSTFGQLHPDATIAVPAGTEKLIGPLNSGLADASTFGVVLISYSAVTSVTVAAVELGPVEPAIGQAPPLLTLLDLPGSGAAYAATTDKAALDITGDIDVRVDVAADDWTPAASMTLISKYAGGGNQRSWTVVLLTTGRIRLTWSADGIATTNADSTANPTVTDGGRLALRVTMDVDNGASQKVVTFYTAPTIAGPWTQLGTPITTAGVTSIFAGTAPLQIGTSDSGANLFAGNVYGARVLDGIDITTVANPDFTNRAVGTTTFDDSSGNTWTLNGTAQIVAA